jgi:transposase
MSRALSVDLRVRVLGAVASGATHREAAERFGVSAASVSRWRKRERDQGDPRPGRLGGDRRSDRIEAHHDAVMAALGPGRDATIEEVRASLAEKGLVFGFGTIQGTVMNLVLGAIVTPMEGAYGNQEGHTGSASGRA